MARAERKEAMATGTIAVNRKARFNYHIEETVEAGIELTGPEVKSLRQGKASIAESYAAVEEGELWLINSRIEEYGSSGYIKVQPARKRKLLVNKKELKRLTGAVARKGYTLIPLRIYFNARGLAKLALGLAVGKEQRDKRADIAKREWAIDKARIMRGKNSR
jgi:SsrA-binding protein